MAAIDNSERTEILKAQSETFEQKLTETPDSVLAKNRRAQKSPLSDSDFNELLIKVEDEFSKIDNSELTGTEAERRAQRAEQRAQFAKADSNSIENIESNLNPRFFGDKTLTAEQLKSLDQVRINAIPGREELRDLERQQTQQNAAVAAAVRRSEAAARAREESERQKELQAIQEASNVDAGTAEQIQAQREAESLPDSVSDPKARIRPFPAQAQKIYGTENPANLPTIMSILDGRHGGTNGVIFPFTPIIQYAPTTEYAKYDITHANSDYQTYFRTPAVQLQLTGHFTAQSPKEAVYCLAVIHFLRTVTKMRFGKSDDRSGEPPPLLLFDCYGWYMFNRLPVIITGFSIPYEKDVDYVPVDTRPFFSSSSLNNNTTLGFDIRHSPSKFNDPNITWIPANFNISVSMYVQIQPKVWRKGFDLEEFRTGELFSKKNNINAFGKGGWI